MATLLHLTVHWIVSYNFFKDQSAAQFSGDLKSEDSVLEWLTDDDNRELEDEIEAVNFRMLDKLLETSPLIAVFFCMYSSSVKFHPSLHTSVSID